MLEPDEKLGISNILNELEDLDIFGLCDTVTKKMFRTTNRQEAIEVILKCTQKPCDILKRQKITRKVLFNYLQKLRFVSPEASKMELVMMCLDHWKSTDTSQVMDCSESVTVLESRPDLTSMAQEFATWFFSLYNQLNDFNTQHFWQDVKLNAELESQGTIRTTEVVGDKDVVNVLTKLVTENKYLFHPNHSSSLACQEEVHGMIKITVYGIVHQFNNPVGIFDSIFGLIRNPEFDHNWKIKWVHMRIKATASNGNALALNSFLPITLREFV